MQKDGKKDREIYVPFMINLTIKAPKETHE